MMNIKKALPAIIVSFLFLAVFNVLSFALSDHLDANFWCGYIFVTLSWVCVIAMLFYACSSKFGDKALFLNMPSLIVSVCHLAIQTIISVVVMTFSSLSVKASLCFQIVIFAVYIALVIFLEIYKEKSIK